MDQGELCRNQLENCIGTYMSTAESKIAPLLISGSWVGWLLKIVGRMTGRFIPYFFDPMPDDEIMELVYKYSDFYQYPITEETAYAMTQFSEGNPFYAASFFTSICPGVRNLTTLEGLREVMEYETIGKAGYRFSLGRAAGKNSRMCSSCSYPNDCIYL